MTTTGAGGRKDAGGVSIELCQTSLNLFCMKDAELGYECSNIRQDQASHLLRDGLFGIDVSLQWIGWSIESNAGNDLPYL